MDRQSAQTRAEVQMNFVGVDGALTGGADSTVMRTDLYGEFAISDFGAYLSLPVTRGIETSGLDVTTVGNLEFGASHKLDMTGLLDVSNPLSLVSHVGLKVPTSNADDGLGEAAVAMIGTLARINDFFVGNDPDMVALRVATSPRLELGPAFLRADVGFDFAFPTDSRSNEALFRGNVGAGVNLMMFTFTGEIANVGVMTESGSTSDNFLHTLALGAQLNTPIAQPHIAYATPLDDGLRGDVWIVSAGLTLEF